MVPLDPWQSYPWVGWLGISVKLAPAVTRVGEHLSVVPNTVRGV